MEDNRPLTNEDFRKLIATPRPGSSTSQHTKPSQFTKEKKRHRHPPPPFSHRKHRQRADDSTEDQTKQQYRDRAAERRMGMPQVCLDSSETPSAPQSLHAVPAHHPHGNKDISSLGYDESKFLGGDLEHTHLVKGLDYAFLSKIRAEQDDTALEGHTMADNENASAAALLPVRDAQITFVTPTGRAIYNAMFPTTHASSTTTKENFLPKRMAFIYNTASMTANAITDESSFEVPTTLYRAKEDCPRPPELMTLGVDHGVLQRLSNIMAYLMVDTPGGKKKIKKKETLQDTSSPPSTKTDKIGTDKPAGDAAMATQEDAKPADNEEDIFGDVGTEYVPERKKASTQRPREGDTTSSYFKDTRMNTDTGIAVAREEQHDEESLPKAGQWEELQKKEQAMLEEKKLAQERAAKRLQMLQESNDDGYAECYPEYVDVAGAVDDSEDDDKKKGGTEDARDSAAGGSGHKEAAKQQRELTKIKKIFQEKGYSKKHGDAFKATETKPASGSNNETIPKTKKRRI